MIATLTLTTENTWVRSGVSRPRSGKRLWGANGARFCRMGREGRRPLRGLRAEVAAWGPKLLHALHSPEARAGSPSVAASRGRRLQRRGRRRIMRQGSWPGRVDPDPFGSARLGPAGPVCGMQQQPSRSGRPTPRPGQRSGTTPELDPGRSRHGA